MSSLKPKEGGSYVTPPPSPPQRLTGVVIALAVIVIAIGAVAYGQYTTKSSLETRIAGLEEQIQQIAMVKQDVQKLRGTADAVSSDIQVVSKRIGVTNDELNQSRQVAEKLRQEQDRLAAEKEQLAKEVATKANSTDVTAVREEAATKVAEAQKVADSKIGTVSSDVKQVAANLETTKQDLAASRRDLVDVKTTLADQIAHNSSELSELKRKGERDYVEFDIKKLKKGEWSRVADIQLALTDTDAKKNKYAVTIQVDDNKLEKKDLGVNQPVQFLVGRDKLRYELVVNVVDKDRIRGYLSAPKDKSLAAERPQFRD